MWFQHDNEETDGIDLTLRFVVARVEKPIQGEFKVRSPFKPIPFQNFFDFFEHIGILKSGLIRAIVLYIEKNAKPV